jgi:hypothetical protein
MFSEGSVSVTVMWIGRDGLGIEGHHRRFVLLWLCFDWSKDGTFMLARGHRRLRELSSFGSDACQTAALFRSAEIHQMLSIVFSSLLLRIPECFHPSRIVQPRENFRETSDHLALVKRAIIRQRSSLLALPCHQRPLPKVDSDISVRSFLPFNTVG